MAVKIYFCGEVVADFMEIHEGSGDFKCLLGGSLFHGATGAQRAVEKAKLNLKIGFVGPLSSDMLGERFHKVLIEKGIDTEGVKRVLHNTTLALVSVRPNTENGFSFYGDRGADAMTTIEDLPKSLGSTGDQKYFCFGSISTVLEPARFAWLEFAHRQRQDSVVFYDLNTRPSIARDHTIYQSIVLEWARTAHIMKASDADIAWAYPGLSTRQVADIWLKAGASMAVFTKGVEGSEAYTQTASAIASSVDVVPQHTIGAGDNFNAGFVINLAKLGCLPPSKIENLSQSDLEQILRGANLVAADHLVSNGGKLRTRPSSFGLAP